jgi:hypothetical protein
MAVLRFIALCSCLVLIYKQYFDWVSVDESREILVAEFIRLDKDMVCGLPTYFLCLPR